MSQIIIIKKTWKLFYEREMQLHSTAFGNQKICLSEII